MIRFKCKITGILLLMIFCLMNNQCANQSSLNSHLFNFDSIENQDELFLIQTDDKYGEWGGDTYFLRLYRDSMSKELLMDYIEFEGEPRAMKAPDPNSELKIDWYSGQSRLYQRKGFKAESEHLELIGQSIEGLLESRIERNSYPTMAGIVNRVISSDSTLIIEDYPSDSWDEFQILKNKIKLE